MNLTIKQKLIAVIATIGVILIAIFQMGLGGKVSPLVSTDKASNQTDGQIKLVSTKPEQLLEKKGLTILPTQTLEFTFNQKLESAAEVKWLLDPQNDVKIELTNEGKTVRIIPVKPYALGQGYTLFIKGGTKFEGKKTLDQDFDFHFTTIVYNGV